MASSEEVSAQTEVKQSGDDLSSHESDGDVPLTKLMSNEQTETKSPAASNNNTDGQEGPSSDDDAPLTKLETNKENEQTSHDEAQAVSQTERSDGSNLGENVGSSQLSVENVFEDNDKNSTDQKDEKDVDGDTGSEEDDMPVAKLVTKKPIKKKGSGNKNSAPSDNANDSSSSDDDVPLTKLRTPEQSEEKAAASNNTEEDGSCSDEDVPLSMFATKLKSCYVPLTKMPKKHNSDKTQKTTSKNGLNENDSLSSGDDTPQKKSSKIDQKENNDSEDDVPLSKLTTKTQGKRKSDSSTHKKHSEENQSESESDHSSDDEPQIKKKTTARASTKSRQKKKKTPAKSKAKKTESKRTSVTKVKMAAKTNKDEELKSDSSDDEVNKRKTYPQRLCKRSPAQKKGQYAESSNSSDDDDFVVNLKRNKFGKRKSHQRTAAKSVKGKYVESSSNSEDDDEPSASSSDDDEPLSNLKRSKSPEKRKSRTPVKSVQSKRVQSSGSSDDDEPLANVKKSKSPVKKQSTPAKRTTAKSNRSKYVESSDSSDDEPLANLKKSKSPAKKKTTPAKGTRTSKRRTSMEHNDSSDEDEPSEKESKRTPRKTKQCNYADSSDGSDEDEPLAKRRTLRSPAKKNSTPAKRTRSKMMHSSESSDDEPLMNSVKRSEKDITFKGPRKTIVADDESLIRVADHIELKKTIRIILEKCHMKET